MTRNRILMTCAIASLALGLSACSSDDKASPVSQVTEMPDASMLAGMVVLTGATIPLPADLLDDQTIEAVEGETVSFDDVGDFMCLSATCSVVVADDVITTTGDIQVVSLVDDLPAEVLTALTDVADELVEPTPLEPTPLEVAQEAAQDAAVLAETAATTAEDAATAAKYAAAGRARIQTIVPSSYKHAHSSQTHAGLARTDANNARIAATAAADAATLRDAIGAEVMAKQLMESAESHQKMAEDSRDDAVKVAATELFVGEDDGDTTYRVGTTTIVLDGDERSNTVGDVTRTTGRRGNIIETKTFAAVEAVKPLPDADTPVAEVVGLPMRVADIDLGEMYDSLEDNARLWLVDAYAGTKTVNLFQRPASPGVADRAGTADNICRGKTCTPEKLTMATTTWSLTPVHGTFLLQPAVGAKDGAVTTKIPPAEVADSFAPRAIFSYRPMTGDPLMPETPDVEATAMDESLVFVEQDIIVGEGTTTYQYDQITVTLGVDFPETTAFEHISYGIWTSLDEETGNNLAALGLGFVDGGENMTAVDDMPNIGTLTYNGNWIATVQAADPEGNGDITSPSNTASIVADFEEGDITVNLRMLADLTGDITDNTFMGTEATTVTTPMGRVAGGEDFTGNFHGGFFGDRAAEAGGVFDFRSEDDKDGGFTGAFGGAR